MLFKTPEVKNNFYSINVVLMTILQDVQFYMNANGHEMTVTSAYRTVEENQRVGATSRTHIEGRAVDIRTWGITKEFQEEIKELFEAKYYHYGALPYGSNERNLINIEDDHIHIQIRPDLENVIYDILGGQVFKMN